MVQAFALLALAASKLNVWEFCCPHRFKTGVQSTAFFWAADCFGSWRVQCRSLFRKEKECKLCSATARQDAYLARVFLAEDSVHSSRSDIPLYCIFCSQLTGARTPASTGSTTVMSKVWITLLCFCQANRQRWICWESDASGIEVEARSSNVTLPIR